MDLNPWLTITTATLTTRAMRERAGQIASALQIDESEIAARLEPAIQARSLAEWLQVTGIDYSAGRELNAIDYPSATFAGVFSSNVLEHVTPAALAAIHRETLRLLSDDGVAVHRINPEDHFKEVDPNITGANFLQYSSAEWHWYGGSGLAYHNRLRCCQHLKALEDAGLQILHARTRPDPEARRAIETGALRVHPEFSGMDAVELTDDYVWVAARKQGTGA